MLGLSYSQDMQLCSTYYKYIPHIIIVLMVACIYIYNINNLICQIIQVQLISYSYIHNYICVCMCGPMTTYYCPNMEMTIGFAKQSVCYSYIVYITKQIIRLTGCYRSLPHIQTWHIHNILLWKPHLLISYSGQKQLQFNIPNMVPLYVCMDRQCTVKGQSFISIIM